MPLMKVSADLSLKCACIRRILYCKFFYGFLKTLVHSAVVRSNTVFIASDKVTIQKIFLLILLQNIS